MKLNHLRDKLIEAGRTLPVDDHVPLAFEKRIMARIRESGRADQWGLWAAGLWRATAPCLVICVLLALASFLLPESGSGSNDFSQDLENTVLVAADPGQPADTSW